MPAPFERIGGLATFASALAITVPTAAQTVLPEYASQGRPLSEDIGVFLGQAGKASTRTQWIHDAAALGSAAQTFTGMRLRPPADGQTIPATTRHLRIDVSITDKQPLTTPRLIFAQNHGPSVTTVFVGTIRLPAHGPSTWPAAWLPTIPFEAPLRLDPATGEALVFDFRQRHSGPTTTYPLEAHVGGQAVTNFWTGACTFAATGRSPWGIGVAPGVATAGRSLTWSSDGYPTNQASLATTVAVIGSREPGDPWLGGTLPLRLNALGLPVFDPSCAIATEPLATVPMLYEAATGRVSVRLQFPLQPTAYGQRLVIQAISLDRAPATGALGVHAGHATISDLAAPYGLGHTVFALSASATQGAIFREWAGTVQLVR